MNEFAEIEKETRMLVDRLQQIDIMAIVANISRENDVQRWIKDTIKERHQTKGIDALGDKMKTDSSPSSEYYSALTIDLKEKFGTGYGSITDYVTLTDTGDFWESLRVTIIKNGFKTEADFLKKDGHMYKNFTRDYANKEAFENAVTGLSKEKFTLLIDTYYIPRIDKRINEILQN